MSCLSKIAAAFALVLLCGCQQQELTDATGSAMRKWCHNTPEHCTAHEPSETGQ